MEHPVSESTCAEVTDSGDRIRGIRTSVLACMV